MKKFSAISNRYIMKNKIRMIITVAGIALTTMLVFAMLTFYFSYKASIIKDERSKGDYEFQIDKLNEGEINSLRNNIKIKNCAISRDEGMSRVLIDDDDLEYDMTIISCDEEYYNIFGSKIINGRVPKEENEVVIDVYTKNHLDIDNGDEFELVNDDDTSKDYKVVGISDSNYSSKQGVFIFGYFNSEELITNNNYSIWLNLNEDDNKHEVMNNIAKSIGITQDKIKDNATLLGYYGQEDFMTINNVIFNTICACIVVLVICMIIVISNSFNISVVERLKYFGIVKAIGATSSQITSLIFKEAIMQFIVAFPIGCLLGYFGLDLLLDIIWKRNILKLTDFSLDVSILAVIISAIIIFITVMISVLNSAMKARKTIIVDYVSNIDKVKTKSKKKNKKSIILKVFKVEFYVALRNILKRPLKFIFTIVMLIFSIVLFNVFYESIDYINKAMQIRKSNSAFDAEINIPINSNIDNSKITSLESQPFIDKLFSYYIIEKTIAYPQSEVMEEASLGNYKNYSKLNTRCIVCKGKDDFDAIRNRLDLHIDYNDLQEDGVIILDGLKKLNDDREVYRDLHTKYKANDIMSLTRNKGYYELSGKSAEYYNKDAEIEEAILKNKIAKLNVLQVINVDPFNGRQRVSDDEISLIFSSEVYEKYFSDFEYNELRINYSNDENRKLASEYFEKQHLNNSYTYFDMKEVYDFVEVMFYQLKIMAYAFIIVVSLITFTNIINTLSTDIILRKKEFATLLAIGMTRKQMRKIIIYEGFIYGIIASIVGSFLSIILLGILKEFARGTVVIQYSMSITPFSISVICILVVTYISTLVPLSRLKKSHIIDGLRQI